MAAKRKSKKQLEKHISATCGEDDDWVIVKKQRITILIPSLQPCERTAMRADDPCANQIKEDIPKTTNKKELPLSDPTDEHKLATVGKAGRTWPRLETSSQFQKRAHPKVLNLGKVPSRPIEVHDTQSHLKRPRRLLIGATASFEGGVFLNQLMRATNLEKKIFRAGGLSNWLTSLGLHQFVGLFHKKKVDKFQVANLTMKKLKDMGAIAVGPRRKLMHAIDCLCQPYCFESHRTAAPLQLC